MPLSVPASHGNSSRVISSAQVQLEWHMDNEGIPGDMNIDKHVNIKLRSIRRRVSVIENMNINK